jgi:hypothetical protein
LTIRSSETSEDPSVWKSTPTPKELRRIDPALYLISFEHWISSNIYFTIFFFFILLYYLFFWFDFNF